MIPDLIIFSNQFLARSVETPEVHSNFHHFNILPHVENDKHGKQKCNTEILHTLPQLLYNPELGAACPAVDVNLIIQWHQGLFRHQFHIRIIITLTVLRLKVTGTAL